MINMFYLWLYGTLTKTEIIEWTLTSKYEKQHSRWWNWVLEAFKDNQQGVFKHMFCDHLNIFQCFNISTNLRGAWESLISNRA